MSKRRRKSTTDVVAESYARMDTCPSVTPSIVPDNPPSSSAGSEVGTITIKNAGGRPHNSKRGFKLDSRRTKALERKQVARSRAHKAAAEVRLLLI